MTARTRRACQSDGSDTATAGQGETSADSDPSLKTGWKEPIGDGMQTSPDPGQIIDFNCKPG